MTREKVNNIVIGICAKNEARNIELCLDSVNKSIGFLESRNILVIINVNNSTDATFKIVNNFIKKKSLNNFFLVSVGKNLVEAQKYIVARYRADIYVFIDADTRIDTKCVPELINCLEDNPKLIVVYATYLPYNGKYVSWAHYVSTVYDTQNQIQTKRYYIHGRVFATKIWFMPSSEETEERILKLKNKFFQKLSLNNRLLIIDDIYLSCYILHNYGINSIKQVSSAFASYRPTCSIRDMYRVYKRTRIEIKKVIELFPEFNYLLPYLSLGRKTNWHNFWFRTNLPSKIAWLYFLIQRIIFKYLLNLEIFLVSNNIRASKFVQWEDTGTSKIKIK